MNKAKHLLLVLAGFFSCSVPVGAQSAAQNQLGKCAQIAYLAGPSAPRTAWLEATNVVNPNNGVASNSRWFVQNPGSTNPDAPNDWLTYLGTDGTSWQAKIRCRWINGFVKVWIESQRVDGTQNHDSQDIYIVDPKGKTWHLAVQEWIKPGEVPVISFVP